MKTCPGCHLKKDDSEFNKNKSKKDGLSTNCKYCVRKHQSSWYKKHQKEQRSRVAKNSKESKNRNQRYIYDYLLSHPCITCGESDIIVLEFDHLVAEEKDGSVSRMAAGGFSLKKIKEEIQKCQVLCANCHRRKTAKQFSWTRMPL